MKSLRKVSKIYYVRQIAACWLVCWMLFGTSIALATPDGGAFTVGTGVINDGVVGGDNTVLVNQAASVIEWGGSGWGGIDTSSSESLTFSQLAGLSNSAVLNNIKSGNVTQFNGTLNGVDMRIFIVNDAGIIFGNGATVNATQLVASSLNISNEDFTNGIYQFSGGGIGEVANYGQISAEQVALIGRKVLNAGVIRSPNGYVLMAAGDRVFLGTKGSGVVVEVSSVTVPDVPAVEGIGDVINQGTIEAAGGTIVLAAGDTFSRAIEGLDGLSVGVEGGTGRVGQFGTLNADGIDGDGGSITLTAGEAVVLGTDSLTTANAGTNGDGGEVIVFSGGMADFQAGALIEAKGGSESGNGGFFELSGEHFLFAGDLDLSAENGSAGSLLIDPFDLTIANGSGPTTEDTVYEETVESFSVDGVDAIYEADNMITVEYMTGDGEITGGSGDIVLRNAFDAGGIYFEEVGGLRTTIHTTAFYEKKGGVVNNRDGGNIFMVGGSKGIYAGDIIADVLPNDDVSDPGQISLLTVNGGDITTGSMMVEGGSSTEISAIASGTLTVNGDTTSKTNQNPSENQQVGKALVCLIAGEDVIFNGDEITVDSHGKITTTADICISAGENVYIATDPLTGEATGDAKITAFSKTTQADPANLATSTVIIHSGWNTEADTTIFINGVEYDSRKGVDGADNSALASFFDVKSWSSSGGQPAGQNVSTGDPWVEDPETWDTKDGSAKVWTDETTDSKGKIKIEIDSREELAPSHLDSPCFDCPKPPFLPPQPVIFVIFDDEFEFPWYAENGSVDVLANDVDGDPVAIQTHTTTNGGNLVEVTVGGKVVGFTYTPPVDAVFEWDGSSDCAVFTDLFTYKAEDADGNVSFNTATVTITVTNFLPGLSDDSQEIHMNTDADFELATVFELPLEPIENTVYIVDQDGTPGDTPGTYGDLIYGLVEGQIPVSDGSIPTDSIPDTLTMSGDTITYSPLDGYVSPTASPASPTTFGYKVTDSSIVDAQETPVEQTGDLEVTVTNELPTGDSYFGVVQMDSGDSKTALDVDGFGGATVASETYSGTEYLSGPLRTYGGDLEYDGDWTYTPDSALLGYVGDSVDTWSTNPAEYDLDVNPDEQFTVKLWNGQRTYYADGHSEVLSTDYGSGTVSVDIVHEPATGDAWFGQVEMDAQDVAKSTLDAEFAAGIEVKPDTFSGTEYLSGPSGTYGGELSYDGSEWSYSTDTALPGYVGDGQDDWFATYDVAVNPDEKFTVNLWDGQITYEFNKETGEIVSQAKVYNGSGTVSVDIVHEPATGDAWFGQVHMDAQDVAKSALDAEFAAGIEVESGTFSGTEYLSGPLGTYGGELSYDGSEWSYSTDTALPGYVGDSQDDWFATYDVAVNPDEKFIVNLWDGEIAYEFNKETGEIISQSKVYNGSGMVSVDLTNALPTASGNLGDTPEDTTLIVIQSGVSDPVSVEDLIDQGNPHFDDLSIVVDTYTGSAGGTLEFNGSEWIYTPASGHIGGEEFNVNVWDGQNTYTFNPDGTIDTVTKVYGDGTVTVAVTEAPPPTLLPAAPLPVLEFPEIGGCPVLMEVVAMELGITEEDIQISIANALALNPNIQPCQACARLVDAAAILRDIDGSSMSAMVQVFNDLAPADAPFSEEMAASIATAFADNINNAEMPQYATAMEYIDAFVQYIAVLDIEFDSPVGDSVAFVMEKYGTAINESDNPNISAYLAAQLTTLDD